MAHEIERKLLIKRPCSLMLKLLKLKYSAEVYDIEQFYLKPGPNGSERRLRCKVSQDGTTVFYYTEKVKITEEKREENERQITEYMEVFKLLQELDPDRMPILKTRYVFRFMGNPLELDIYEFSEDYAILEIEIPHEGHEFEIPSSIEVVQDVTEDPRFKNGALAKTQSFPELN